jgi:two-component system, response regulator YesN
MYGILIVDDEPLIQQGLNIFIRQSKIPIRSLRIAANGSEALQAIHEELPDFVFTDIRMPVMDGLDLCKKIDAMEMGIQVVVISGHDDFKYAQTCVSYGVKEYLLKPVSKAELYATLDKLVHAKSRHKKIAYLSVAKMDEWLARYEYAIYYMEQAKIEALLHDWKEEILTYQIQDQQVCEMLVEFHDLLMKKLKERDVNIRFGKLMIDRSYTLDEGYQLFESSVLDTLYNLQKVRKGKPKDPIEEAKLYIERNLASEVSLDEVAEILGLHPNYFSLLFKQVTGETFVQYRTKQRMEYAKKLLSIQHNRITDISFTVGYADHSNFAKTFKKYEGISPSEYRMKLGIQ